MKNLLVLCFVVFVHSAPQGYNYQAPPLPLTTGLGASSSGGFSSGFASSITGGGLSGYGAPQAPIITKHFYIHSAPEDQDERQTKTITLGPPRKNYRVVFIKAPSAAGGGARIQVAAPQNEEKTVIYVLTKKADLGDIQADVQQSQVVPSKPEVFFIRYKTQEEALHAQRQIQAQYDALGGTSQITDEGLSPVSSVIGSLGGGVSGGGSLGSASTNIGSAPSNAYLPSN